MKATEDLFLLIKSLTKSEKRYFKLYAGLQQGDKNYIKLFDIIYAQEEYNEDLIKQFFKGETFIKQLSVTKNYLYRLILKSLDNFYSGKTISSQLMEWANQAIVLYKKEFYEKALKILEKARVLANRYEYYPELIHLLAIEKRIANTTNFSFFKSKRQALHINEEEQNILIKLKNRSEYWNLHARIYNLIISEGAPRNKRQLQKYENVIKHPLLDDISRASSVSAKHTFYSIMTLYSYAKGDKEASHYALKNRIKIFESDQLLLKEYIGAYIAVIGNYLKSCNDTGRFAELDRYLKKLKELPVKFLINRNFGARIFEIVSIREIQYSIDTACFEAAPALIKNIEEGIKVHGNKISKIHYVDLCFGVSYLYFILGDYRKSLFWFNKKYNIDTPAGKGIEKAMRLVVLLIHYELKNSDVLSYYIKSTYRFLKKEESLFRSEKLMLDFFKDSLKNSSIDKMGELLQKLKKQISVVSKDPFEKNLLSYFDFISWINCKIENKSFREVLESKRQKFSGRNSRATAKK